jgi:pyroglutamyl-peptidase
MRILVTGFERFGPNDLNPTALLMDRLAGREGVIATVLPVEYHTSVRRFEAVPDNAGMLRRGLRIVEDGPVGYWSTLPVDRLIEALGEAGLPVDASGHAGGYVCNHLFYGVRHALERRGRPLPMGFVHVPPLPEQIAGEPGRTGLALSELERAAEIILWELGAGRGGTPSA